MARKGGNGWTRMSRMAEVVLASMPGCVRRWPQDGVMIFGKVGERRYIPTLSGPEPLWFLFDQSNGGNGGGVYWL